MKKLLLLNSILIWVIQLHAQEGRPPLFHAMTVAAAQKLIVEGVDIKQKSCGVPRLLLHNAMKSRYPAVLVKFYLDTGLDVNEKDDDNFTALHWLGLNANEYAEDSGMQEIEQKAKLLLNKGALINEMEKIYSRTPIDCALQGIVKEANERFVELLRGVGGKMSKELPIKSPELEKYLKRIHKR